MIKDELYYFHQTPNDYLTKVIVCNIKKWSNRYYFLIFTKSKNSIFEYLDGSY